MDDFEKFVRENRQNFDDREPGEDTWNNIRHRLDRGQPPQGLIHHWIWKAASIILFAAVLGLLAERQFRKRGENLVNQSSEEKIEFRQVEEYYTSLIASKRAEIGNFLIDNPSFRNEFAYDINQLDSMYTSLKGNLTDNYSEKIVDAMIVNLRMRMQILNQQLSILQKIKNTKQNEKPGI
jgi:hypothetical protein